MLAQKQEEAKEQLKRYVKTEEVQAMPNLRSYAVVILKDKIYVDEIKGEEK